MKAKKLNSIFLVIDKSTGNPVGFGSKVAWATSPAAKNAVLLHGFSYPNRPKHFEDQNDFVIEELLI